MENKKVLVQLKNVTKEFNTKSSSFGRVKNVVHAVTDVTLDIYEGETLGVVGESGCGKSTLGRLMLHLLEPTRGDVIFDGQNLNDLKPAEIRDLRKGMQMIFQDPYASLNPRMKIKDIVAEPLVTHKVCSSKEEEEKIVENLLSKCGIRPEFMWRYPHQFSGGQRQRVSIARALALNPKLIVCDEPVSALDVSIQSQVLNLLGDLQVERNLTYVFISHDLSVVRYLSDRVCVMFLGKVCELGITRDIYANPMHPYTKFLLEAVPIPDPERRKEQKDMLSGEIPSPVNPPSGCFFRTRCPYATEKCAQEAPELKEVEPGRFVACHLVE
ncbi:MAG: ATP-binding cassette domain-containing protein [Clostridia bacterium]|nr:ATP-binding cassette domain-containing protein [Clostridia bacterium]MDO5302872.1 ATP-binding cassette domain-containing protein [Clostridia bacterium]